MTGANPPRFRRRVLRKQSYDYSLTGAYFVTICTRDKALFLGRIDDGIIMPSVAGAIVDNEMKFLPERFAFVRLGDYVVMPNHVHCILFLSGSDSNPYMPGHVGSVVRAFKAASTRLIRSSGLLSFAWQANYYDHIIRTEADLERIREYVRLNPKRWDEDPENPHWRGGSA